MIQNEVEKRDELLKQCVEEGLLSEEDVQPVLGNEAAPTDKLIGKLEAKIEEETTRINQLQEEIERLR